MHWVSDNLGTLQTCFVLTLCCSLATVVGSVIGGAVLAYHARPRFYYGAALAALFFPFSLGASVWAYSIVTILGGLGVQAHLLEGSSAGRAGVLFVLCLARSLPLGVFFCATTLQRYTVEVRPYIHAHKMHLLFFVWCAIGRLPKSLVALLGLFAGALMATEASLPIFLYRANPGTQPETLNVLLSRLFREVYAVATPESLSRVATFGLIVSSLLLVAAVAGTLIGQFTLMCVRKAFGSNLLSARRGRQIVSALLQVGLLATLLPGLVGLGGLLVASRAIALSPILVINTISRYRGIILLAIVVGCSISVISIALAVRLRYSARDYLRAAEKSPFLFGLFLFPAFLPVLCIVAALGMFSGGELAGPAGYFTLVVSHQALHYPVFQFLCMALIAAVPESRVAWQRTMRISYWFSLEVDGFRRHCAVIVALVGLGAILVVTDGSISRWFSHLVEAPEEVFYAALFGRLSSASEAFLIASSVGIIAAIVCLVLANVYLRDLRTGGRDV